MKDVVASIYSPGVDARQFEKLKEKFDLEVSEYGFICTHKTFSFDASFIRGAFSINPRAVLIIGWGLETSPGWQKLLSENLQGVPIQHFFGIDLYERKGVRGKIFKKPKIMTGPLYEKKTTADNMELFLKKYWVLTDVPYGLCKYTPDGNKNDHNKRCVLKAGDVQELEIVKFIFTQYVIEGMSRQNICNLLNAEKVATPGRAPLWRSHNLNKTLTEPAYIGAVRYKGCILYEAFPPILEPHLYFQAQAMLHQERTDSFPQNLFIEENE